MIRARILRQTGFNRDAETSLRIAIDVAQSQGAKGFELVRPHRSRVSSVIDSKLTNGSLWFTPGSLKASTRVI